MNWLKKFMIGRYGIDQLTLALLMAYVAISLMASMAGVGEIRVVAYIVFGLCLFRVLSYNITKRQKENLIFLKWWTPIISKLRQNINQAKSIKTHRFYRCPNCRLRLRVPKGKGRIRITCPRCKEEFTKKT